MSAHGSFEGAADLTHDEWLQEAINAYARERLSVEVNFRELAPDIKPGADRFTHLIHPYPAKLLASIPHIFLRCQTILPARGRVLDPFCGSGTVLLEAALAGHRADGADANPLARRIAAAKLTAIDEEVLEAELEVILGKALDSAPPPDVVNLKHWFGEEVIERLAAIRSAVAAIDDDGVRGFFEICLSSCARKVSLADPRLSVPVKINRDRLGSYGAQGAKVIERLDLITGGKVAPTFASIARQNIARVRALAEAAPGTTPPRLFDDARALGDRRYDLVITSPPYVGAQKYVRASSLGLGWLGLTPGGRLRELEKLNIGREHYAKAEYVNVQQTGCAAADTVIAEVRKSNPLRAHIASNYLVEMRAAFKEMARVTADGGWLVLISGQNLICNLCFDTPAYLEAMASDHGFETKARLVDDIRSRGLMTKRNRTAGVISQEIVAVMQKRRG